MKIFLLISFTFILTQSSIAQSKDDWVAISTGNWMYDLNSSPFVSLYKMGYFIDDDGNKKNLTEILSEQNINLDTVPYAIIHFKEKNFLALKKKQNGEIKMFKILKEHSDFFILCNQDDSLCRCRSGTYLYYRPNFKLQRIEKPFSFSLKKNLIDRLKYFNIELPLNYNIMTFCELLETIK